MPAAASDDKGGCTINGRACELSFPRVLSRNQHAESELNCEYELVA